MLNINKNNLNFGLKTVIKYNCLCQYMRFYYLHPPLYSIHVYAKRKTPQKPYFSHCDAPIFT